MQNAKLLILVIGLSLVFASIAIFFERGNGWDTSLHLINIPKGYGAGQVTRMLLERKIISSSYGFNLSMRLLKLENKLQAGVYEFSPGMSYYLILNKIKNGETVPPPLTKITFPEGTSIYKMAKILEKEGVGDPESFSALTRDALTDDLKAKFKFLAKVKTGSLEGYLFPDSYLVPMNVSTPVLVSAMLRRFAEVGLPVFEKARWKTDYDLHEIITLASIIEKEAVIPSERPIISSVYHNRLRIKMKLDADPTVKYVLGKKIVSPEDLKIDSPYNTYRHRGLPPGPICSPGLSSIQAALEPARTTYLYFVARPDGSHVFSRTFEEHLKAQKILRIIPIR